ncbi:MAG: thioredoxin family protein [Dysgonamonadaceae bacterium]|jgi:hypothetical protein|nr:thioredoxin family protein [Dysgonamonadaceae bacterium]
MLKKILSLFILSLAPLIAAKAEINIHLPHFAGKQYVHYIMQGDATDTITRGSLDESGRAILSLPEEHKDFRGMSKFMLPSEGGLEIILNREADFTVSCAEAAPNVNNIFYTGSAENNFLFSQYHKQSEILDKAGVVGMALQVYHSRKHKLNKPLIAEQKELIKKFEELQRETATSNLYAARIHEMGDFITGTGSSLTLTEAEIHEERKNFAASKVDLHDLYNSGLWNDVLESWVSIATTSGDSVITDGCKQMLARTTNKDLHRKLLGKLTLLFYKYGKERLLAQLGEEDLLAPGHRAPMLRLNNARIYPSGSLIIFYESGCNSCENELLRLHANYLLLHEKGLRVISVSADRDEETYRKNAAKLPWFDKYCDYKGFEGENFVNYNIPGTPVIFVTDKEGFITGRYARLEDYLNSDKE